MRRAVDFVGSRFRHDIDEAAGTASELRGRAVGHHLEFLHRVQVHRERGTLSAALLAEERIVVVRSVDGDVVVDAFLAVDRNLIAVGALHNRHAGRERNEVEEIAPVVRQRVERLGIDVGRALDFVGLDDGSFGRNRDRLLRGGDAEHERKADRLPDGEIDSIPHLSCEVRSLYGDLIAAERQQEPAKTPIFVRRQFAREVRPRVQQGHAGARNFAAGRVAHGSFDGPGIRLRLGMEQARREAKRNEKR